MLTMQASKVARGIRYRSKRSYVRLIFGLRGIAALLRGGPALVKAATGEEVFVEELGCADMHTSVSGTGDYAASSGLHAIAIARHIGERFQPPDKAKVDWIEPEPPA